MFAKNSLPLSFFFQIKLNRLKSPLHIPKLYFRWRRNIENLHDSDSAYCKQWEEIKGYDHGNSMMQMHN